MTIMMMMMMVLVATVAATQQVACSGSGVLCLSAAACEASFGEVHTAGACARSDAVCCVVGVKLEKARLRHVDAATRKREMKRQFGDLLNTFSNVGKVANTVGKVAGFLGLDGVANAANTVGNLANTANMLNSGLSAINSASSALSGASNLVGNAAGQVSNLAGMIPTTLPNLPTLPTFAPYTLPDIPTDPPGYTQPPYTLPPSVVPKPNTNPHTGLPIGVDPNNPNGLGTNAMGQFVNEYNVVVDKFGNPAMYSSYQGYTPPPVQYTNAPATKAPPINAVPGGGLAADTTVNADNLGTNAMAPMGLPVGAYVGIGVVGFLCLMLVCVLIYCATTRSRNNLEYNVKNTAYDPNTNPTNGMWGMAANNPDQFGSFNRQNTAGAFGGAAAPVGNFGMFAGSAGGSMYGSELGRHGNPRQNFGAFGQGTQGNMQPSYTGTVAIPNPSGVMSQRDRFVTAADLPAPGGPLRKDTENAAYGLSSPGGPSTTFVGGDDSYPQQYGTQYMANGFTCRQCGKSYNYQSDLDAHKAQRGHSDDMNGF